MHIKLIYNNFDKNFENVRIFSLFFFLSLSFSLSLSLSLS